MKCAAEHMPSELGAAYKHDSCEPWGSWESLACWADSRCKHMSHKLQAHKWVAQGMGRRMTCVLCRSFAVADYWGWICYCGISIGSFLSYEEELDAALQRRCLDPGLRFWPIDTISSFTLLQGAANCRTYRLLRPPGSCSTHSFLMLKAAATILYLTTRPLVCFALEPASNLRVLVGTKRFRTA
jgi:hypothetical protein